jgi:hypothetical protein
MIENLDALTAKYEALENEWYRADGRISAKEMRQQGFTVEELRSFAFDSLYWDKRSEIEDGMPGREFFDAFFAGYA